MTTSFLAATAAAGALAALPAAACSVAEDYRVPSNLELAAEANAIVLGRVVGAAEALRAPDEALLQAISIEPLATLKGLTPGGTLIMPGMLLAQPGVSPSGSGVAVDFAEPHPEARAGACIRRSFPAGATVLFFLRRADGGWVPAGGPFSRWAEDVSGPEDPWVQLATLYVHAAQLVPGERQALLEDQLEALQARIDAEPTDDPVTLALATDLERTMADPGFPQLAARRPEPPPASAGEAVDLGDLGAGIDALASDTGE